MAVTLLMLPPQTSTTRDWAKRLAAALPGLSVVVAEDGTEAAGAVGRAEAAFGTMPAGLLREASRLRWIQAPPGGAARRLVLPGADRAPGGRDQFPRDLQ
jgi:hypothetical protein